MLERFVRSSLEPERAFTRWNFVANVFDGALFSLAMSLVSLHTVLPVFVQTIGGSNVAVGLIPVVWMAGFNFPQIFIANYVQKFTRKKSLMLMTAMLQRSPWLLLAAIAYFYIGKVSDQVGLLLFFAVFALAAVGGSINLPVWFDLIAKITPLDLRGRLFAARIVLGAVLGIFGGWVVTRVLVANAFPNNFATLFVLAFLVMMLSYVFLAMLRERDGTPRQKKLSYQAYLRSLPQILGQQRNYRNFLIADALLMSTLMASAFYTVSALEKFSLPDAFAGTFTMVMMGSTMIGNLLFGYLADHFGHRLNLLLSAAITALTCILAILAPSIEIYLMVFVGAAFAAGLNGISRLSIIAEFSSEEERPTYIALTNMVTSPFVLSGVFGGWIANGFGYDAVFIMSAILASAAALWLTSRVEEPRRIKRRTAVESVQYEC